MKLFKRKFKNEYKKQINYKIAHPENYVPCPRCGRPLNYSTVGNGAEVKCTSKRCIMGDSWGRYRFQ